MLTISKTLGWRYAKKGALNRLNRERSYVQSRLMPRFLPWRTKQNGTVSSAFWKSAVWSRVILSCLKERQADILDKKIYSTISAVNGLSTIFPMASSPCLLDCFPRSITFSLYFCFLCFTFLTPKIEINWQLQSKLAALKFVMRRRLGQKWQLGQSWQLLVAAVVSFCQQGWWFQWSQMTVRLKFFVGKLNHRVAQSFFPTSCQGLRESWPNFF